MTQWNVYHVFLLRLWQEIEQANDEGAPLRVVLEDPRNGQRLTFASLEALLLHLQEVLRKERIDPGKEAKS
ncbi:MAG TPA: hypothetical protein VK879_12000 [Candidatus Sulfomarinibacteraceae bacterium]|nr:hypothetical protein [Candidatus Sulfomarinibacteraceae bacterium]